ncbi:MAG: arylsulfatase [Cyclobacteriaceae bacterium]
MTNLKRALFVGLFAIVLFSCKDQGSPKNPNIIYILADDLGYGDLSVLNPEGKIATPHLDQLAKDGMIFTDAHTSSSVCTPTRYGIVTGRYNWRSELKQGVLSGKSKALIPTSRTTIASLLKKAGYHTAFMGKWHLGWDWVASDSLNQKSLNYQPQDYDAIDFTQPISNSPNDLGFDYAYGIPASLDIPPYVYVEDEKVTAQPDKITVDKGEYSWWREGPTGSDFIHEDVTPNLFRKSISYVKERAEKEEPFFLYLPLPSPHTPILPTEEWLGKSNLLPYGDFVMMIDHYVGQLIAATEEMGIDENTLIVFTSDNGCSPAAGFELMTKMGHFPSYHFRGHKADIYEGGHRVPFLVKWPAKVKPGEVNDQLICTTDLMATLADITGQTLQDNEGEDSFSMLPHLVGEITDNPRTSAIHHSVNGGFAIRKGDWKLIMAPGSAGWSFPRPGRDKAALDTLPPIQLYNLVADPGETNNLQAAEPEIVEELKALLTEQIKNGRTSSGTPQQNDPIDFEWKQVSFMD